MGMDVVEENDWQWGDLVQTVALGRADGGLDKDGGAKMVRGGGMGEVLVVRMGTVK
jgi:hypothetical protein